LRKLEQVDEERRARCNEGFRKSHFVRHGGQKMTVARHFTHEVKRERVASPILRDPFLQFRPLAWCKNGERRHGGVTHLQHLGDDFVLDLGQLA